MKTVAIRIAGASPLLMHRFGEQSEADVQTQVRRIQRAQGLPRDVAEAVAYRLPTGELYLPSTMLQRAFVEAAADYKQRGKRQSMKYAAGAAFLVDGDVLSFDPPLRDFEVDSRPVVIPATKGRVMRHRPRLDAWSISTRALVDESLVPLDLVLEILGHAGRIKGLGDFRPQKGGPFGRFQVTRFEEAAV